MDRYCCWLLHRVYQRKGAENSAFLPALEPDLLGEGMVLRVASANQGEKRLPLTGLTGCFPPMRGRMLWARGSRCWAVRPLRSLRWCALDRTTPCSFIARAWDGSPSRLRRPWGCVPRSRSWVMCWPIDSKRKAICDWLASWMLWVFLRNSVTSQSGRVGEPHAPARTRDSGRSSFSRNARRNGQMDWSHVFGKMGIVGDGSAGRAGTGFKTTWATD